MNSTQAYVIENPQERQPSRRSRTTRGNTYRTPCLWVCRNRPTRSVSRSTHPAPSTTCLTENSSDISQPKRARPPAKPSPSNEDLALSLSAAAWNNLGIALASLEQYDGALSAFEQSLKLDPSFDRAQCNARRMQDRVSDRDRMD